MLCIAATAIQDPRRQTLAKTPRRRSMVHARAIFGRKSALRLGGRHSRCRRKLSPALAPERACRMSGAVAPDLPTRPPRGRRLLYSLKVGWSEPTALIGVLLAVALPRLLPYVHEAERVAVRTMEAELNEVLVLYLTWLSPSIKKPLLEGRIKFRVN